MKTQFLFINPPVEDFSCSNFYSLPYGMLNVITHFVENQIDFYFYDFLHPDFAYSNELYNLELNADLVVLSACETGLGKLVRGEGILGFTRGLLYSGARNIIVSLWKVMDKSTSEFMIDFYRGVLEGDDYTTSLRETKLKMIKEGKYSAPKYWAPFVLIGK